jgi:hypothetical protein
MVSSDPSRVLASWPPGRCPGGEGKSKDGRLLRRVDSRHSLRQGAPPLRRAPCSRRHQPELR